MTLTTGGRLFVFLRGELEVSCSAGAFAALGIFVDGVPASASGYRIPVGEPKEVFLWGISEPVAAGEHTLRLGADCANGKHNSSGASGDGAIGAILLGS